MSRWREKQPKTICADCEEVDRESLAVPAQAWCMARPEGWDPVTGRKLRLPKVRCIDRNSGDCPHFKKRKEP